MHTSSRILGMLLLVGLVVHLSAPSRAWSDEAPAEEAAVAAEEVPVAAEEAVAEEVDTSRTFGPAYYGTQPIKFLSNEGAGWDLSDAILGDESAWDFGGWVSFGYTNDETGLFNSHPHNFHNHQTWFYIEKALDTSKDWDWGGRFDVMYGVDAQDTQAFGNNPGRWDFDNDFDHGIHGWAFPQLYLEMSYGDDIQLKGGHFYTLVGYEVVTAPDNFFFSHAFTMYLSEPFTHTGALVTYTGIPDVTLYGGWTAGWDTGFDQFDDGGSSFLGGVSWDIHEQVTATYILTAGDLGANGGGYSHSIVIDTTPIDRLNYVLQSDLVMTDSDVLGSGHSDYETIGINQYLIYWLMDEVGVGTRFEWWKANGTSYYGITGGVNLRLLPNLIVRPEGRYQWSPAGNGSSGETTRSNPAGLPLDEGGIFGIDVILTF